MHLEREITLPFYLLAPTGRPVRLIAGPLAEDTLEDLSRDHGARLYPVPVDLLNKGDVLPDTEVDRRERLEAEYGCRGSFWGKD